MSITSLQTIQNNNAPYVMVPRTMQEAMEYSKLISTSCFCPKDMKGKPGDVMVAIQMGAEIGLSPLQALQNIAVINGRPCLWGDAALAVVIGSPNYVCHREWLEGDIKQGTRTAFCSVTRRGSQEHIKSFSMDDAKKAGLWDKAGPWKNYPERMLQMRARAFAFRDKFADALRGINFREEVEDFHEPEIKAGIRHTAPSINVTTVECNDVTESKKRINKGNEVFSNEQAKFLYEKYMNEIEESKNELALKKVFDQFKNINWSCTDYLKQLIDAKDRRKMELKAPAEKQDMSKHQDFLDAFDGDVEVVEVSNETV